MNDDFFDMKPKGNNPNGDILRPDVIEVPNGGKIVPKNGGQVQPIDKKGEIVKALTDKENFGRILDIVGQIVQIKTIKVQTEAQVALLEQERKKLQEDTDSYVRTMREDTNGKLDKAKVIENMMLDFYKYSDGKLSGEQFQAVICKIIDDLFNRNN